MKRYLYILLAAVTMMVACEPEPIPAKPDVAFCFSTVAVETTSERAIITAAEPYITVDGVKYEDAQISLEYKYANANDDTLISVYNYEKRDGNLIFTIENLAADTLYTAYIVVDGGDYGTKHSEPFTFTTKGQHVPVVGMTCTVDIEAMGLMATANLSNIAYLVDGKTHPIHVLRVEYKRTSAEEWITKEFNGSAITDGTMCVELPFEGEDYLEENRNYHLRATLFPESGDYEPLTSEEKGFVTDYAEITANIAAPTLRAEGDSIYALVENIEVFYDGVKAEEYNDGTPVKYYFYYRVKGAAAWSKTEVSATNGDISAIIPGEKGKTYEVMAVIVAGAMQKARESQVAEVSVPNADTPIPPTPPVGDGDTSAVAGVWHLTEWRGDVPSFEVYMDINAEGGLMLYQRLENNYWDIFASTATVENGIISGTYTDGVAWGASYSVTVSGDTMTWIATNDSADISVYTRSELPSHMPTATTRAAEGQIRFL